MTLAQKTSEMNSSLAAAIPGLGVNAWSWWNEAAHGVAAEGVQNNQNPPTLTNTTSYPTSLSLGSSWDPALMHQEASMIGDEAREVETNNDLNMDFYAPVVNLMRDPRWGRSDEAFSEDPFLTTIMGSEFVDGMQGQDMVGNLLPSSNGYYKTLATLKHYTANNSEVNRLTGSSNMDERTLREYYTEQFRNIVRAAHPGSIMSSYNEINGTPSPVNVKLTDTLARETFGFGGYFTSDCDAIYEVQHGHNWTPPNSTTPVNAVTRHAYALSAGEDLDCNQGYNDGNNYANQLPTAVSQHVPTLTDTLSENDVDVSVERLFTARMELGEFDDSAGVVPWVNQARQRVPQGTWQNSDLNHAVTETPPRLALARRAGDEGIVLLKNATTTRKDGSVGKLLPLHVPTSGPFKVAVIGYFANPAQMYLGDYSSNQGVYGTANEVNGYQGIKSAIQAIDPQATVDWYPGVVGGDMASQLNTVDPASVAAASKYDDVIVYAGADASTATEGHDRPNVALPGAQASLISQVAAQNPNTIVYMETNGMQDVTSFQNQVPAMLWSAYNGMRKGQALADVLLGNYSPSARLPFTWYLNDSQLPSITDYTIRPSNSGAGRTYMYFGGPVSYPFGYGLSYTTFRFSHERIDNRIPNANQTIHVHADVTNTGSAAGNEVVELYVNTPDAPAALERPMKRLEGFQMVSLQPGETKTVTFALQMPNLAFFNQNANRWEVDEGRYGVQISTSSADSDIQLERYIDVRGSIRRQVSVVTAKPTMPSDFANDIHDRLIFPAGVLVEPNLTVSMSDDTLYGYVTKGSSTPFPAGMTFSYSSDHPDVVAVGRNGSIHTGSTQGVATITATVTYRRVTKTAQFIIDNTGTAAGAGY
ncbi:MAG: glycoside hydrolase family 3 C-terminal domain-containing protein [Solirubrobacterales bacterium]|nr:glycoside hydrolase family 3 C-terminal domain-containing protein [Solirubrobacterales bacterium]